MLSDSIFEAINKLTEDIRHYSQPPFSYSNDYRINLIEALAQLYYVLHCLDGCRMTMEGCRVEATDTFDLSIRKPSEDLA
jgi:hypothetical protein